MTKSKLEKFIDPNGNDMFSYLKGLDLQDLIMCIEKFYLTYRTSLGLPEYVTFGTEIEYEGVFQSLTDIYAKICLQRWDSRNDGSLSLIGGEIVSPVMHDDKTSWDELKKICHFLKRFNADTYKKAGGHVHIGAHILGNDFEVWKTFLKLYVCYENILFRFGFGDKATGRIGIASYAYIMASKLANFLNDDSVLKNGRTEEGIFKSFLRELTNFARYSGINFQNLRVSDIEDTYSKNTVEYRFPNASIEEVVWQNNINAFAKMMLVCRNQELDVDFLEYRFSHSDFDESADIEKYRDLDLKKALEFVDLVFDKNIDKVYFLRQYLKGFYNVLDTEKTVKAKRFIR